MRLINTCLAICLLSSTLFAADNAFLGTWKLNTAKSKFTPDTEIKNMTVKFEADGANVKRIADGTDGDGTPIMEGGPEGTSFPWDGQEHQVTKPPGPAVVVMVKQLNGHAINVTIKMDGKVVSEGKTVVSRDGKTLTSHDDGTSEKGIKFHNVQVFDKQ